MRDIAADNLRNQTGVNLFRGALLFHSFHSQRLIWGQYSRERSGYDFQHENIWNDSFSRMVHMRPPIIIAARRAFKVDAPRRGFGVRALEGRHGSHSLACEIGDRRP